MNCDDSTSSLGTGGAALSGDGLRKKVRKKLVEAIMLCNDKRRAEYMGESKMLLREVWHACHTHACLPIRACQSLTTHTPIPNPSPPPHTHR